MAVRIFIIILNYKSPQDTISCAELLLKQGYQDFHIVIVDNKSDDDSVASIRKWVSGNGLQAHKQNSFSEFSRAEAEGSKSVGQYNGSKIVLIRNDRNSGYSAGNNIGIRYAIQNSADAVLIVNPDVRIDQSQALRVMADVLFSNEAAFVVGPNVIGPDGMRQGPLREPGFWEELIRPFTAPLQRKLGGAASGYLEPLKSDTPFPVEKIPGCCLMIRSSFIKKIGMLDEGVFLYSEEPILAAQVKLNAGKIFFVPEITVRHLHQKPSHIRMYKFLESRRYYHRKYSDYNVIQLILIRLSHVILLFLLSLKKGER